MHKWSRFTGVLFVIQAIIANAEAISDPLSAKMADLKAVQSRILKVDKKMGYLRAQQQGLQKELAELDKKIGFYIADLRDLQSQIDQKNVVVSSTEKKIRAQMGRIDKQRQGLKEQILFVYQAGRQDRLKLVLNNQDAGLASRLISYGQYLNKFRLQKAVELEANAQDLVKLKQQQQQVVDLLSQDLQTKQAEQSRLLNAKRSRAELLQQLHGQWVHDRRQLSQLKDNERSLRLLLRKLQDESEPIDAAPSMPVETEVEPALSIDKAESDEEAVDSAIVIDKSQTELEPLGVNKNFNQLKGRLPWPVVGKVRKKIADEPLTARDGIVIEAPEGSPVRAVAEGRVVYADWLQGYGLLTIVNHGGGYMTVYAFNQTLFKKVGSQVGAGEVIASVGQSGGRAHVGLYFEIRKHGQPLSPQLWCKK